VDVRDGMGRRRFIQLSGLAAVGTVLPTTVSPHPGGRATHWAVRGDDVVASAQQALGEVPPALRHSALEIESVLAGLKPACRLVVAVRSVADSITYLRVRGLSMRVSLGDMRPSYYAQPTDASGPWARIYVARSADMARELERLEADNDYEGFGLALGYPRCCVEAASRKDVRYRDERHGTDRRANLNVAALLESRSADFRCNQLLAESWLSDLAPTTPISHFPCRLDCRTSTQIGMVALELCARKWPLWSIQLIGLLRSPALLCSDEAWAPGQWDEYAGLCLPGARPVSARAWSCTAPMFALGAQRTSLASLEGSTLLTVEPGTPLRSTGSETTVDLEGEAWLIDWSAGSITALT
jgi:hypothetical protein